MRAVTAELEAPTGVVDVEGLYRRHHRELMRLAALALGDAGAAEAVVHDVFAKIQQRGLRLRDEDKVPAYLRSAVLNRCRSEHRRTGTAGRARMRLLGNRPVSDDVERATVDASVRAEVMAAIRRLPARQRDCVLLRYYLDLSEAETADTLGVSAGTVKSTTARARQALAPMLEALR